MGSHKDLFLVQHLNIHQDGGESVKLIGIYSSEAAALQAVERLKSKPGFCEIPEGFSIDLYTLDEDNWTDGYLTVRAPGGAK